MTSALAGNFLRCSPLRQQARQDLNLQPPVLEFLWIRAFCPAPSGNHPRSSGRRDVAHPVSTGVRVKLVEKITPKPRLLLVMVVYPLVMVVYPAPSHWPGYQS